MHVIAAKAVALGEALKPDFKAYQKKVLENARTMAAVLTERGLRIVSGRTDCHMFLVDLRSKGITGKDAEAALGRAHITVNKNAIPNDPREAGGHERRAHRLSGHDDARVRRREARELAHLIADVLERRATTRTWRASPRASRRSARVPGLRMKCPFLRLGRHAGRRHAGEPRGEHDPPPQEVRAMREALHHL
jgi:glycine hydroxymethyltransferase